MIEGKDFTAIDSEKVARPLYRVNKVLRSCGLGWTATTAMAAISYKYFEKLVVHKFRDRLLDNEFDLVHRITPLSPAISSPALSSLCNTANVPFILGPINGGVPWPQGYKRLQFQEGDYLSSFRNTLLLNPNRARTLANSTAIIVGSSYAFADTPSKYRNKTVYLAENAVTTCAQTPSALEADPIRVVFIGRLVKLKMVSLLISAVAAHSANHSITLDIIGDGPERDALEKQVRDLDASPCIKLLGWVKHDEVIKKLSSYHILGFPSIREFGGGVVLEAMASGVVPIVVDYAGPSELVDHSTGFKVPLGNPDELTKSYQKVLREILENPDMLEPMRRACIERVKEHFTWDAKARKVLELYKWVLGQRETNPEEDPGFLSFIPDR